MRRRGPPEGLQPGRGTLQQFLQNMFSAGSVMPQQDRVRRIPEWRRFDDGTRKVRERNVILLSTVARSERKGAYIVCNTYEAPAQGPGSFSLTSARALLLSFQVGNGTLGAAASRRLRVRRQEALVMSVSKSPSTPPKDRLHDLQLHLPELFSHVSLKGFKRLLSQVRQHVLGRHET